MAISSRFIWRVVSRDWHALVCAGALCGTAVAATAVPTEPAVANATIAAVTAARRDDLNTVGGLR
jgi:hypothetical protein